MNKKLFIIFILFLIVKTINAQDYKSSSILSSGEFIKIRIDRDGIYKLTYTDLINMGFSNPLNIKIFGNGGGMLPEMNNEFRYDDLEENAVWVEYNGDSIFDYGDYILFRTYPY